MLLKLTELKALLAKLDAARHTFHCPEPNVGPDGETFRVEPKPHARAAVGTTYPDGTALELVDGAKAVRVPLGPHGRAHLAIDTETGETHCAACEGVRHGP